MAYNDIPYEKIPTIMKRYSWDSKIKFCMDISRGYTSPTKPDTEAIRKLGVLPHTLEAIFLFAIMHIEHGNADITERNNSMLKRIIESIDNFSTEFIKTGHNNFTSNLVQAYLPTQFKIQDNTSVLLARYHYLFNYINEKIDMKSEFYNYYRMDYSILAAIMEIFTIMFTKDKKYNELGFNDKLYSKIMKHYQSKGYLNNFIKTRDEYIELQEFTTRNDIKNYLFCVKAIYQYPFIIENDGIYLPLPHVLKNAFTDSLLFRLVDGNQKLKSLFGKEVFENYVYELFYDCSGYEAVEKSPYFNKGEEISDVLITNVGRTIFVECKTTFPRAGIRIYSEEHEEREYKAYIENILQVYKSMKKYSRVRSCPMDSCYGIVVNLIDNYIKRDEIYKRLRAADEKLTDEEISFIENHIKCMDVYWVERLCCYSNKLVDEYLYEWALDCEHRFDFVYELQCESTPKGLLKQLNNKTQTLIEEFLDELEINGVFKD